MYMHTKSEISDHKKAWRTAKGSDLQSATSTNCNVYHLHLAQQTTTGDYPRIAITAMKNAMQVKIDGSAFYQANIKLSCFIKSSIQVQG